MGLALLRRRSLGQQPLQGTVPAPGTAADQNPRWAGAGSGTVHDNVPEAPDESPSATYRAAPSPSPAVLTVPAGQGPPRPRRSLPAAQVRIPAPPPPGPAAPAPARLGAGRPRREGAPGGKGALTRQLPGGSVIEPSLSRAVPALRLQPRPDARARPVRGAALRLRPRSRRCPHLGVTETGRVSPPAAPPSASRLPARRGRPSLDPAAQRARAALQPAGAGARLPEAGGGAGGRAGAPGAGRGGRNGRRLDSAPTRTAQPRDGRPRPSAASWGPGKRGGGADEGSVSPPPTARARL